MGLGDWIMASADVKRANLETGKKVKLGDGRSMYVDPEIFKFNPRMAKKDDDDCVWVKNYPAHRPYMLGTTENKRIIFNDAFSPTPGEIFFSDAEEDWADKVLPKGDYIVVEPNVKNKYQHASNKSWPKEYWAELFKLDLPFIQLGDVNARPQVEFFQTSTFRQAMLALSRATLFVGTDGGLHHAAAALAVPAVVIWTGFTSPKHLGYKSHVNIHDGGDPCGYFGGVCGHCQKISRSILPERVIQLVEREYEKHKRRMVA
jgi:ADP-heptose:LPS heptosyltransferase